MRNLIRVELVFLDRMLGRMYGDRKSLEDILTRKSIKTLIFARQFVVWVILIVTPTPGGAGVSEWLFTTYYGDLISGEGMALVLALFWRIISYYSYLMVGACILPAWIRQGFRNRRNNRGLSSGG